MVLPYLEADPNSPPCRPLIFPPHVQCRCRRMCRHPSKICRSSSVDSHRADALAPRKLDDSSENKKEGLRLHLGFRLILGLGL